MATNSSDVTQQDLSLEELSPFLKCDRGMHSLLGREDIRVYRILPIEKYSDIQALSTLLGISLGDTSPELHSVLQWGERMYVWDSNIVDLTFSYLSQLSHYDPVSLDTVLNSSNNKLVISPPLSPPYSGICHIVSVFPNAAVTHSTGWFVSNFLLITSGFTLYSKKYGGVPKEIRISPGRDGTTYHYGEIVVTDKRCFLFPKNCEEIGDTRYVGVLVYGMSSELSSCFKWKTAVLNNDQSNYTLSIAGYTCTGVSARMRMTGLQVETITADKFYYRYTATDREWGAPVWAILDEPGVFHVVGIQDPATNQLYASATRLTHKVLEEIDRWTLTTDVLSLVSECDYHAASERLTRLHLDGFLDLFEAAIAVLSSTFDIFKIGYDLIDTRRESSISGSEIVMKYFDKFIADILLTSRDEFSCFHLHRVEDYSRLSLTVLPNRLLGDNLKRCAMFHGVNRPNYAQGGNIRIRPYFQNGILLYFHLERKEDGSRISLSGSVECVGENESRCARYHQKREVANYCEGGNLLIIPIIGNETYFNLHRFEDRSKLVLSNDVRIGAEQWGCAKFAGKKNSNFSHGGNMYISSFKIIT